MVKLPREQKTKSSSGNKTKGSAPLPLGMDEKTEAFPDNAPSSNSSTVLGGTLLKRERLLRKETLEAISHKLHIKKSYLKAIEAEDFENLPELSYTIGFVRTYANYLGLDPHETAEHFKTCPSDSKKINSIAVEQSVLFTAKTPQPKKEFLTTFALVVLLLFAGWLYFNQEEASSLGTYTLKEVAILSAPESSSQDISHQSE